MLKESGLAWEDRCFDLLVGPNLKMRLLNFTDAYLARLKKKAEDAVELLSLINWGQKIPIQGTNALKSEF
jgi:hypothetical protein